MIVRKSDLLEIAMDSDTVRVRQTVRIWCEQIGINGVDQTKMVTAASELARNALVHGGGGTVRLEAVEEEGRPGLRLTFEDHGPGIPDIELALQNGYTTRGGLGLGLGGARRLVNEFQIDSRLGEGTRVTIVRWKK